jgi:sortase (surface protein transpeptidase)
VGLQPSGKVQTPVDYDAVGWYAFGPPPGEVGASVILGHVDSRTGPAVFFRLRDLAAGDDVVIRRVDGVAVRFVVDRLGQYERGRFPTVDVYGPEERSELRLVTCAGPYKGHYRDNLVVFLHRLP